MAIRMVVDFPAPFAPTNPTISPGRTVSETPSRARVAPKFLVSPRTASTRLNLGDADVSATSPRTGRGDLALAWVECQT